MQRETFERILQILSEDADFESVLVDGTIVRVHRRGQGAKGGTINQSIGKSRGGVTTRILALVDALGNLARFRLMPGQRGETTCVAALLDGLSSGVLLGGKAYDADWLRRDLPQRGAEAVIPPRANRLNPADYDEEKYKWRRPIGNFFQKLKELKGIATISCKTDSSD